MLVLNKFVVHAALFLKNTVPAECAEPPDLPEEARAGRLPQFRGPAIWGIDSRAPYNGTGTVVLGTSTMYYY